MDCGPRCFIDLNKYFKIHTNARKFQLGAVIRQYDKPIAFYIIKRSEPQTGYTVTERGTLSIFETQKYLELYYLVKYLKYILIIKTLHVFFLIIIKY